MHFSEEQFHQLRKLPSSELVAIYTVLFRLQIRQCLMLVQIMSHRLAGSTNVDISDNEASVENVVFSLHLQDRFDDDEDDPDEPSLDGIEAAPRFHYW